LTALASEWPAPEAGVDGASRAPPAQPHRDRIDRILLWTLGLGTVSRLIFVMFIHRPYDFDWSDMHSYIERAVQMADPVHGSNSYDWYYPSGTSAVLSIVLRLFREPGGWTVAAFFQAMLSSAEILLIFMAARRYFGRRIALVASILFAADYMTYGYAGYFLSENYLEIGLVGAMAVLDPDKPRRGLLAGLLLGFGAWAKSQAFLLAPLWALVLAWRGKWRSAGMVMVGALLVVVPVSIYVSKASQHPVFISNNGGQTFALGQCPIKEIHYDDRIHNTAAMFIAPVLAQRQGRGEIEASWQNAFYHESFQNSGYYLREGLHCIERYPRHALRMAWRHFLDTFVGPPDSPALPWPDSYTPFAVPAITTNYLICLILVPLGFVGAWKRRREVGMWLLVVLPIASLLLSAVLFHGDPRFREPYDFCFFIAAASLLVDRFDRRRGMDVPRITPRAVEP
jgi:4-amino-4-deoxy-L-arabinose transferase-like glycosyltransferase